MYDIIIVGAGPAGLTAALYALRANKKVLILESNNYGGQIINASIIENYPGISNISGFDYATNLCNQVKKYGADIKYEKVIKIDKNKYVTTNKDVYLARSIIIATGAKNRKLKLENEEKFIGKGISYCATCDGNFYKDKIVAVVGGGNTALEDALYLSNIVKKVYLIHRRAEFRGENAYVDDLKNRENIEFILNANIISLRGNEKLESIEVKNELNEVFSINVDGLFIAIGQEPKNDIFKDIIDVDESGYIISSDGVHTNCDGIYVAGDARSKELRQLTTAVSDGSIAATVAIKEMNLGG